MFDTFVAWLNPPALVREVLIAMLMVLIARFFYWRVERHWERFTGYVSSRTKKSRARRDYLVRFYEENSQLLPLHVARISHYQFMLLFCFISMPSLAFVNHFVGTGSRVMTANQIATFHLWIVVATLLTCCYALVLIHLLSQAQSIATEIQNRALHEAATPD